MVSFMFGCKDIVYCFLRSYEKIGKGFTFADSFNLERCMKKYQSRYSVGFMPRLCATYRLK